MAIGMVLHRLAPPRPSRPSFTRQVPTTVSPTKGDVTLHFYVPKSYRVDKKLGKSTTRHPVVVNFHGGGFTIGSATDDARWATAVVEETGAVVVSVEYRLAPEYPFPTAVEDGVDAVLYVAKHAKEFHLDANRIAISGFSAGGNLCFTVPLRLHEEQDPQSTERKSLDDARSGRGADDDTPVDDIATSSTTATSSDTLDDGQSKRYRSSSSKTHPTKPGARSTSRELQSQTATTTTTTSTTSSRPTVRPVAIVSWYPSTDYTLSRSDRRATCARSDMEISPVFTALFDSSYLHPATVQKSNPYLSPACASDALLRAGLPDTIVLFTCEWDMLASEGRSLAEKLVGLGKKVWSKEVKGVPHGWDKAPNPWRETPGVREHYREACGELRRAFGTGGEVGGMRRRLSLGLGGGRGNQVEGTL